MKAVILKGASTANGLADFVQSIIYGPKLNWSYSKVFLGHCATFFCRKIDFFPKKPIFGAYFIKFDQISNIRQNDKKRYKVIIINVYPGGSETPKKARKCRHKKMNTHGKILNWPKFSFFDVRSTVFAPNRHKKSHKVESSFFDISKVM